MIIRGKGTSDGWFDAEIIGKINERDKLFKNSKNTAWGRFLKDGANVLPEPVTDTCNLSISLNKFPSPFKLDLFSKKAKKLIFLLPLFLKVT